MQVSPRRRWLFLFEKLVTLTLSKEALCLTRDLLGTGDANEIAPKGILATLRKIIVNLKVYTEQQRQGGARLPPPYRVVQGSASEVSLAKFVASRGQRDRLHNGPGNDNKALVDNK